MQMKTLLITMITFSMAFTSFAEVESLTNTWNGYNNPYKLDRNFKSRLTDLPLQGDLGDSGYAWPDSYWPNYKGSIAWRWNAEYPQNFRYHSPTLREARLMTAEQLNELSPAEKYDLYVGDYSYPTVRKMWRSTSPRSPIWYGICHGIAPASLHYKEPKTVTVTSADGITLTFYASDVKALLGNYYAREGRSRVIQVGKRCFSTWWGTGCSDINAGSFHIILANRLGLTKDAFIADIDPKREVWNHAPISFQSHIVGSAAVAADSHFTAVSRVKVRTTVKYTKSIEPTMNPVIGTELALYDVKEYIYYLDLNSWGKIVGGSWVTRMRPDFVWYKEKVEFTGYWTKLNEIYVANDE